MPPVRQQQPRRVPQRGGPVYEQQEEGAVVGVAHAVAGPGAVVVHPQHAALADAAVVAAGRLVHLALLAVPLAAVLYVFFEGGGMRLRRVGSRGRGRGVRSAAEDGWCNQGLRLHLTFFFTSVSLAVLLSVSGCHPFGTLRRQTER